MNQELLDFIKGSIRSVWALELLLLMRNGKEQIWTRETSAKEQRSNPNLTMELLAGFEAAGLVVRKNDGYSYAPASPLLDELCAELERIYHERPVAVINAIVSSRTDRLQIFADAFRFRGEPKT
ncbi:MAG TPA: hypothetical protein VMU56_02860 [Beijerinckiaceae bacterium]|nr:hypothetical protein [Beijerinckiaceae bacterium]